MQDLAVSLPGHRVASSSRGSPCRERAGQDSESGGLVNERLVVTAHSAHPWPRHRSGKNGRFCGASGFSSILFEDSAAIFPHGSPRGRRVSGRSDDYPFTAVMHKVITDPDQVLYARIVRVILLKERFFPNFRIFWYLFGSGVRSK